MQHQAGEILQASWGPEYDNQEDASDFFKFRCPNADSSDKEI
jgi:hypothetical protein